MAVYQANSSVSVSPVSFVVEAVSKAIVAVSTWNQARFTRRALLSLSSRQLEDIGLTRADIEAVAKTVR